MGPVASEMRVEDCCGRGRSPGLGKELNQELLQKLQKLKGMKPMRPGFSAGERRRAHVRWLLALLHNNPASASLILDRSRTSSSAARHAPPAHVPPAPPAPYVFSDL